jgi:hypothetical protein
VTERRVVDMKLSKWVMLCADQLMPLNKHVENKSTISTNRNINVGLYFALK